MFDKSIMQISVVY